MRVTDFHRGWGKGVKLLELNFSEEKLSTSWSKQTSVANIVLATGQFARSPGLTDTPACVISIYYMRFL